MWFVPGNIWITRFGTYLYVYPADIWYCLEQNYYIAMTLMLKAHKAV